MIFHRIKSDVVAHLSYFIGSGTEAMVVDPQRDVDVYLKLAKESGVHIKYIFETHRNEDYVIGSKELSHYTDAEIYHGPWPDFKYGNTLKDGQIFKVGTLRVEALHTPGHTPGDMSYAVTDLQTGDSPVLVCTGDTLFIGDTGRTDFGGPEKRREWSEKLYESIHNKLLSLGDHVLICPGHGSGSVCGGKIAEREESTLGAERLMNPVLQFNKEEFINLKVEEEHQYTPYFKRMEKYNLEGPPFMGLSPYVKALSPNKFKEYLDKGATLIDSRPPPAFGAGHIEDSYSIPTARLAMGGWVLPFDKPIVLIVGNQSDVDYISRSYARMGFDNIEAYLGGTIASWYKEALPVKTMSMITPHDLKQSLDEGKDWFILDVRSKEEYESGYIESCKNIYAGLIPTQLKEIPKDKPIAIYCKSGTRSSFVSSILLRNGYKNVHNMLGGMTSWIKANYPYSK
ncbi:MBL fold metallo-hydrolase [Candidatus Bathyarchaeota archaeon]|nr:MBL fold metallo-hydrolase [Candidatus Bathyarchaeota archaeon]